MAIALVQQQTTVANVASGNNTVTYPGNVTVGNIMIVTVELQTGTATASLATGLASGGWSSVDSGSHVTASRTYIFWGTVTSAGTTITVTVSSGRSSVSGSEWSGLTATSDGTNSNEATTGTSISSGSITTVNANDLVIAMAGHNVAQAVTAPSSPWNALHSYTAAIPTLHSVYQIVSSTNSFNPSWSWSSSTGNSAAIVALQASSTGSALPLPILNPRRPVRRLKPKKIRPVRDFQVLGEALPAPPLPIRIGHRRSRIVHKPKIRNRPRLVAPPPPPQALTILPLPLRGTHRKRKAPVVPKGRTRLRLVAAPPPPQALTILPLPLRTTHRKRKIPLKPKHHNRSRLIALPPAPVVPSANLPLPILAKHRKHKPIKVVTRHSRNVRLLPTATVPILGIIKSSRPNRKVKPRVLAHRRSAGLSVFIPKAAPVITVTPLVLKWGHRRKPAKIALKKQNHRNAFIIRVPRPLPIPPVLVPFAIQTPGDMPDTGAEFTTQRLYIAANLNVSGVPQILTPILIVDGVEYTLPQITNTERTVIELSPKIPGRFFEGVKLIGQLSGRVEIFSIEADVWLGETMDGAEPVEEDDDYE